MNTFRPTLERTLPWLLIIGGSIGLIAAFIIMVEKIHLLSDPSFSPSCDLNPVISCGSVMASHQSSAFGFPNPLIGLITFPVVITSGVLMAAGAKLKRWYMLGLQAGTVFGLLFVHWLFFQSTYYINALCPYCIAVWIVTITTFWYVFLFNVRSKCIALPARLSSFLQRHHLDILLVWFLILVGLILKHFWYYYGPLLGF
ncbi:MAG TPA: vitamin K epoxide reductase family protein [Candidatus Saccharimonadales bacterium]